MAMIDYGTILVRNDKIMNYGQFFMDGVTDRGSKIPDELDCPWSRVGKILINGNYYACAGDNNFMLCFYKTYFTAIVKGEAKGNVWLGQAGSWNGTRSDEYSFVTKNPYEKIFNLFGCGVMISCTCLDPNIRVYESYKAYSRRFKVSFIYNGDRYDIYTGYGIDSKEEVYEKIKFTAYDFSDNERDILDEVFRKHHEITEKEV